MTCQAARKAGRKKMTKTARGMYFMLAAIAMVLLALVFVVLARAKPAEDAQAGSQGEHALIAFEEVGDIWVVTKMHPANLTPDTASYNDVDPAVSPDGRRIAFASDRDGDFEIYLTRVSTGEVQQVTDNAVDDRSPVWSPDGQWISYHSPHYSSPTHSGIFSTKVEDTPAP
jgi:dipeptidyl aminopeptidase/acylaminoacyl peptidase